MTVLLLLFTVTHSVALKEIIGGPLCFISTTGSLYASLNIRQLDASNHERYLVPCPRPFDTITDSDLATQQYCVKAICGIGNIAGFTCSPSYVASTGVALSSPFITTFYWHQTRGTHEAIPDPVMASTWLTLVTVGFNSWRKIRFEPPSTTLLQFIGDSHVSVKISVFIFWIWMAWKLKKRCFEAKDLSHGVYLAIFAAYDWLSVSGSIGFICGRMMESEIVVIKVFGWLLLLITLATGEQFVQCITIAETHEKGILIWLFAQLWFAVNHSVYMFFFLGQYQYIEGIFDFVDFFGPLFLMLLSGWYSTHLQKKFGGAMPSYRAIEEGYLVWSNNRLTFVEPRNQIVPEGATLEDDKTKLELCTAGTLNQVRPVLLSPEDSDSEFGRRGQICFSPSAEESLHGLFV